MKLALTFQQLSLRSPLDLDPSTRMRTLSSSMTDNENEDGDEHIITVISDDELNDYYDMATDDDIIFDEGLRKMF